jgi:hypothetical protein
MSKFKALLNNAVQEVFCRIESDDDLELEAGCRSCIERAHSQILYSVVQVGTLGVVVYSSTEWLEVSIFSHMNLIAR